MTNKKLSNYEFIASNATLDYVITENERLTNNGFVREETDLEISDGELSYTAVYTKTVTPSKLSEEIEDIIPLKYDVRGALVHHPLLTVYIDLPPTQPEDKPEE